MGRKHESTSKGQCGVRCKLPHRAVWPDYGLNHAGGNSDVHPAGGMANGGWTDYDERLSRLSLPTSLQRRYLAILSASILYSSFDVTPCGVELLGRSA